MILRTLPIVVVAFLFGGEPSMASYAALEVKIIGVETNSDTTRVSVQIDNPVDFAMHAVYFRVTCGDADDIRYRTLVVSPEGKLDAESLIAQEHPDAVIVVDQGFPGGSSVEVDFDVPIDAGVDATCQLDMRGSW